MKSAALRPVKSAERVLSILHIFDDHPAPLSCATISDRLMLPKSSVADILKTLVARGYLSFNPLAKTYLATMRVAGLGRGGGSPDFADRIFGLLDQVSEITGGAAYLTSLNGVHLQIVGLDRWANPILLGQKREAAGSSECPALLAAVVEARLCEEACDRLCAQSSGVWTAAALIETVRAAHATGFVVGPSSFMAGQVTTWPLRDGAGHPIALSATRVGARQRRACSELMPSSPLMHAGSLYDPDFKRPAAPRGS